MAKGPLLPGWKSVPGSTSRRMIDPSGREVSYNKYRDLVSREVKKYEGGYSQERRVKESARKLLDKVIEKTPASGGRPEKRGRAERPAAGKQIDQPRVSPERGKKSTRESPTLSDKEKQKLNRQLTQAVDEIVRNGRVSDKTMKSFVTNVKRLVKQKKLPYWFLPKAYDNMRKFYEKKGRK